MNSFDDLVAARKGWINDVLKAWCQQAVRAELLKAQLEWIDIAGKVDPEKTLWLWAWSRFPDLVHESLGIEESFEVQVELRDGTRIVGYPDGRKSQRGQLVLWGQNSPIESPGDLGPYSIDDVIAVRKSDSDKNAGIT